MTADFEVSFDGSLYLLTLHSDAAREWGDEHLPEDATRWAGAYVIEHGYIDAIIEALLADGFVSTPVFTEVFATLTA